jgi:hypothetical protein
MGDAHACCQKLASSILLGMAIYVIHFKSILFLEMVADPRYIGNLAQFVGVLPKIFT